MDTLRYVFAVLLLVSLPAAILFWLIVHPFIGFWRRVSPATTFAVTFSLMGVLGAILYVFRDELVGRDLGTHWWLFALGLLGYLISAGVDIRVRTHLRLRTLVGVPELRGEQGELLVDGPYRVVRHPRYFAFLIGVIGWSLMTNYSGTYLLTLLGVPGLYLIAWLEERELIERFGERYREYKQGVPRLIPRATMLLQRRSR